LEQLEDGGRPRIATRTMGVAASDVFVLVVTKGVLRNDATIRQDVACALDNDKPIVLLVDEASSFDELLAQAVWCVQEARLADGRRRCDAQRLAAVRRKLNASPRIALFRDARILTETFPALRGAIRTASRLTNGAVPVCPRAELSLCPPPPPFNLLESVMAFPRDAAVAALLASWAGYAAGAADEAPPALAGKRKRRADDDGCRDETNTAVVVLCGAGGAGKSTIAAAIATHPRIVPAFDDIAWLTLGQASRTAVLRAVQSLLRALEDPLSAPPDTLEQATERLRAACVLRRSLLVIDDVWDADAALPFLRAVDTGASSVLFTTRSRLALDAAVSAVGLSGACVHIDVGELPLPTALQLLRSSCRFSQAPHRTGDAAAAEADISAAWESAAPAARALFAAAGTLPLVLVLAGACVDNMLRDRSLPFDALTLTQSLDSVTTLIRAAGGGHRRSSPPGSWLDRDSFREALLSRNPDAAAYWPTYATMQAWIEGCFDLPKFALFGLLPDVAHTHEDVLAVGWQLSKHETHRMLEKLQSAGLVKWERCAQVVAAHSLARDFAVSLQAMLPGGAAAGHVGLLDKLAAASRVRTLSAVGSEPDRAAFSVPLREWWATEETPVGSYITFRVIWHLLEARAAPDSASLTEAAALLLRLPWLQRRLRIPAGYSGLVDDVSAAAEALGVRSVSHTTADESQPIPSLFKFTQAIAAYTVALAHLLETLCISTAALQGAEAPAQLPERILSRMASLRGQHHATIGPLIDACEAWKTGLLPRPEGLQALLKDDAKAPSFIPEADAETYGMVMHAMRAARQGALLAPGEDAAAESALSADARAAAATNTINDAFVKVASTSSQVSVLPLCGRLRPLVDAPAAPPPRGCPYGSAPSWMPLRLRPLVDAPLVRQNRIQKCSHAASSPLSAVAHARAVGLSLYFQDDVAVDYVYHYSCCSCVRCAGLRASPWWPFVPY
jgi:hypothetical protein